MGDLLEQVQKKRQLVALAKTSKTHEIALSEIKNNSNRKVITLTERVNVAEELAESINRVTPDTALLHHGGINEKARSEVLEKFQNTEGCHWILVTTRPSLGVSVNLQCANVVIFNDLPWSPAGIQQAVGRVKRLNQSEEVKEYWMESSTDFDRNLLAKLQQKLHLIKQYAEGKNLPEGILKWMHKKVSIYEITGIEKPKLKNAKQKKKVKNDLQDNKLPVVA